MPDLSATASSILATVRRWAVHGLFLWFTVRSGHLYYYLYLRWHGVDTRLGYVRLIGRPIISRAEGSVIFIDKNVTLVSSPRSNPAGISHPVILATLRDGARIEIRSGCGLSGATICAASSVTLGCHVMLGVNAAIYDTDFHPTNAIQRRLQLGIDESVGGAPVTVGEDAWLCMNSVVLKGVRVGDRAIIAAGAVVTRDVPDNAIAGGIPAKVIGHTVQ